MSNLGVTGVTTASNYEPPVGWAKGRSAANCRDLPRVGGASRTVAKCKAIRVTPVTNVNPGNGNRPDDNSRFSLGSFGPFGKKGDRSSDRGRDLYDDHHGDTDSFPAVDPAAASAEELDDRYDDATDGSFDEAYEEFYEAPAAPAAPAATEGAGGRHHRADDMHVADVEDVEFDEVSDYADEDYADADYADDYVEDDPRRGRAALAATGAGAAGAGAAGARAGHGAGSEAVVAGGVPKRGLAMILIAVALLLGLWGVYSMLNANNGGGDNAAQEQNQNQGENAGQEANQGQNQGQNQGAPGQDGQNGQGDGAGTGEGDANRNPDPNAAGANQPMTAENETINVFNNSTVPNLAADVSGQLQGQGTRVGEVGNITEAEAILEQNTVFFDPATPGAEERARVLAERVGGIAKANDGTVPANAASPGALTLVLTAPVVL